MVLVYSIGFSGYSILRYRALRATYWDLGLYNHSFWTLLYGGRLLTASSLFFAGHISPLLLAFAPLYAVLPGPPTLLVIQSFALGLAALPIYLLIHDATADRKVATLISSAYLLYAPLHGVNAFDFHVVALFPIVLSSALLFWRRGNWHAYYVCLILAAAIQEFAPVLIGAMGLGSLLQGLVDHRRRIPRTLVFHIVLTIVIAIGAALFEVGVARLVAQTDYSGNPARYYLGGGLRSITPPVGSVLEVPGYLLRHPVAGLLSLFADFRAKVHYLLEISATLMFLPILAPPSLIPVVAWVGLAFLTKYEPYYSIYFQYSAYVIPFIFSAVGSSLEKLAMPSHAMRRISVCLFFVTLIASSYLSILSPLNPYNGNSQNFLQSNWWPTRTAHQDIMDRVAAFVPRDGLLMTQNDIGSITSGRRDIWVPGLRHTGQLPDYILVDLSSIWFYRPNDTSYTEWYQLHPLLANPTQNAQYGVYAYADGVLLYKRNYEAPPALFEPYNATFNYNQLSTLSGTVIKDKSSSSGRVLASLHQNSTVFWFGPPVMLPPGTYNVTYTLKIGSPSNGHVLTVDVTGGIGASEIMKQEVIVSNFTQPSEWRTFTFSFHLDEPTPNMQFRGVDPSPNIDLYVDYVNVSQTSV